MSELERPLPPPIFVVVDAEGKPVTKVTRCGGFLLADASGEVVGWWLERHKGTRAVEYRAVEGGSSEPN